MREVFTIIDRYADEIASDLTFMADAISGIYERTHRSDPTARGVSSFMSSSADAPDAGMRLAEAHLKRYSDDVRPFRNASLQESQDALESRQIALLQVRNMVEHVRLVAARRLRAASVSRNSIARPAVGSLKVLNRAGQRIQATTAFYLLGRKALIDAFNEPQIESLAERGEMGVVVTKDPNHTLSGKTISPGFGPGDAYVDIQESWFHPRSYALVSRSPDVYP